MRMSRLAWIWLLPLLTALLCGREAYAANWESFQASHVFDPSTDWSYQQWTACRWIQWLAGQEPLRFQANNGFGVPLTSKGLNTVIVASPDQVSQAYANPSQTPPYVSGNVWSATYFPVIQIVFKKNEGVTQIYRCPDLYIAAALDGNRNPVHLQAAYNSRPASGNANYPLSQCSQIR